MHYINMNGNSQKKTRYLLPPKKTGTCGQISLKIIIYLTPGAILVKPHYPYTVPLLLIGDVPSSTESSQRHPGP